MIPHVKITTRIILILLPLCLYSARSAPDTYSDAGIDYLNIASLQARFGMSLKKPSPTQRTLFSKWTELELTDDSRLMLLNGQRIYLNAPVLARSPTAWYVAKSDADKTIAPLLRSKDTLKGRQLKTIVIDPGHGGSDTGTRSTSGKLLLEKEAALDVARRLKTLLETAGYTVHLTRGGDINIDLEDRPKLAAHLKADLFVSLHFNYSATRTTTGIETFAMTAPGFISTHDNKKPRKPPPAEPGNKLDPVNMIAALDVQSALVRATKSNDRGVKHARFRVLRVSTCPSILVEAGFLSNPGEAGKVRTSAYRDTIAKGISQGIKTFGNRVELANKR